MRRDAFEKKSARSIARASRLALVICFSLNSNILNAIGVDGGRNAPKISQSVSDGAVKVERVGKEIEGNINIEDALEAAQHVDVTIGFIGVGFNEVRNKDGLLTGYILETVVPGGAAAKSGLHQGDVITHINGEPAANKSLKRIIEVSPGSLLNFSVSRGLEGFEIWVSVSAKKSKKAQFLWKGKIFSVDKTVHDSNRENIVLIMKSESIALDDKQSFLDSLSIMSNEQLVRSADIFKTERRILEDLHLDYQEKILEMNNAHLPSSNKCVRKQQLTDGSYKTFVQEEHTHRLTKVAAERTSRIVASAYLDGVVKLWDVDSAREIATLSENGKPLNNLAFSADGRFLAGSTKASTIRIWSVEDKRELESIKEDGEAINALVFSNDGNYLASANATGVITLREAKKYQVITSLRSSSKSVNALAFAPNGDILASVVVDQFMGRVSSAIELWDVKERKIIATLKGSAREINSVSFSPDGRMIASGVWQEGGREAFNIRLLDVKTGNEVSILKGHVGYVTSVIFSPDGKYLYSASIDDTVRKWEVSTGKQLAMYREDMDGLTTMVMTPNGRFLVRGGRQGKIGIRNLETDLEQAYLVRPVRALLASDLKTIATVQSPVSIFNLKTGALATFAKSSKENHVHSASISSDGGLLARLIDDHVQIIDTRDGHHVSRFDIQDKSKTGLQSYLKHDVKLSPETGFVITSFREYLKDAPLLESAISIWRKDGKHIFSDNRTVNPFEIGSFLEARASRNEEMIAISNGIKTSVINLLTAKEELYDIQGHVHSFSPDGLPLIQ